MIIDLQWPEACTPDQNLLEMIEGNLDTLIDRAMEQLGVTEFPKELRTIVPEAIILHPHEKDGNWSLSFRCVEWDDGIWGVVFGDSEIVRDYEGD